MVRGPSLSIHYISAQRFLRETWSGQLELPDLYDYPARHRATLCILYTHSIVDVRVLVVLSTNRRNRDRA